MAEKTIRKVNVLSFALMFGAISAAIGFIVGLIMAVFSAGLMSLIPTTVGDPNLGVFGILFGLAAIIIIPIIAFIVAFIQGVVVAVIYNFLAPRIGGIKLVCE